MTQQIIDPYVVNAIICIAFALASGLVALALSAPDVRKK